MNSKEFQDFLYDAIPLVKKLGLVIEKITAEEVATKLSDDNFNKNHLGTVYAGIQFSVMEVTGGILFASVFDVTKYFMVVSEMSIQYHKAAKGILYCTSTFSSDARNNMLEKLKVDGKADYELPVELKNSDGEIVATAKAKYFVSPRRK